MRNPADNIPKVLKRLFLFSKSWKEFINLLVFIQYIISRMEAKIIEGLNIKYVGYVLAVQLIETPPSI